MLELILAVLCAGFYYKAADVDDAPKFLWVGLSLVVSLIAMFTLPYGVFGIMGGQVALLFGITGFRMLFK